MIVQLPEVIIAPRRKACCPPSRSGLPTANPSLRRWPLVAALILLGACAAPGQVQHNDDGTWSIQCAGGYHDWSQCHERASAVCRPHGFEILSRVSNEGSSGVGTRDWSAEGSEVQRTLVIRCRDVPTPR